MQFDDERKIDRYHRGFSFCSPDTLVSSVHQKIKKDIDHLFPIEDVEVTAPKELFYLPNLLTLEPDVLSFFFDDLIDTQVLDRLERFNHLNWWAIKEPKNRLYPIITRGDGNCLLHAASLGIYGVHDKELTLRTAVHKLLPSLPSLRRRWQYEMRERFKEFGFDIELTEEQWNAEWEDILSMSSPVPIHSQRQRNSDSETSRSNIEDLDNKSIDSINRVKYQSLEDFHVYVLSNVLHRPVIVIAMNHVFSQNNNDPLAPVYFGGLYLPLDRDPDICHKTPLVLAYDSSHFVPLLPLEDGDAFVPLVDCSLNPLPIRFAIDPQYKEERSNSEVLDRYMIVCRTTVITKELSIKAEFEHVDINIPKPRPQFQVELLNNYISQAADKYEVSPQYIENRMYTICKYLSVIPQHKSSCSSSSSSSSSILRLSNVTRAPDGDRQRVASQESSCLAASLNNDSTTSTLKSNKSTSSSKSLQVFKKYFKVHRRFASTSNIEKKRSETSLDQQHKAASVGDVISTVPETSSILNMSPQPQRKKSLTSNIKRRLSQRKKSNKEHNGDLVSKLPSQSCMTACFGLQKSDSSNGLTTWQKIL